MRKNPPLPIPMIDSKTSVKDFIKIHFIRYDELAKELGYDVAGNSIKSWLIGRFRPPKDFEKVCKKNKKKLLKYSNWKLREKVFENNRKRKPQGFWEITDTHRYALEWICKKEGWDFPFGLYSLSKNHLQKHDIDGLSNYYSQSPINMVTSILNEYEWYAWKFQMTPMNYWKDDKNKIEYLKWFEKEKKINSEQDWYEISFDDIKSNYGGTLFSSYFNGSITSIAKFLYPNFDFDETRFIRTSHLHLNMQSLDDIKKIIERKAKKRKYKFPNDYYNFNSRDFKGIRYSNFNVNSFAQLLNLMYKEHHFYEWLFDKTPNTFWDKKNNIIDYTIWLTKVLEMESLDEWYDINNEIIYNFSGGGILKEIQIYDMAKMSYPDFNWDASKFDRKKFTSQKRLYRVLTKIYPNKKIDYNKRHHDIINPKTNYPLELDCFIPSLNLAFEYQGEQHFVKDNRLFHSSKSRDSYKDLIYRDKIKKEKCKDLNIALIEVSKKNWDFSISGLKKIIKNYEK